MGGEDDQEFAAVRRFETVSAGPVGDQAVGQRALSLAQEIGEGCVEA